MRLPWIYAALRAVLVAVAAAAQTAGPAAVRPQGFSLTAVFNRVLTPNGDGKNDTVVWQFNNPQFSDVSGQIFDIRGRLVASLQPGPAVTAPLQTLQWDGRAGGALAPGGVYIYVITAEGHNVSGTVVVIR